MRCTFGILNALTKLEQMKRDQIKSRFKLFFFFFSEVMYRIFAAFPVLRIRFVESITFSLSLRWFKIWNFIFLQNLKPLIVLARRFRRLNWLFCCCWVFITFDIKWFNRLSHPAVGFEITIIICTISLISFRISNSAVNNTNIKTLPCVIRVMDYYDSLTKCRYSWRTHLAYFALHP